VSVGHLARIFEDSGLSTVIVAAQPFGERLQAMAVPRLLLTPFPMGRVFGPPGDVAGQVEILEAALKLLESAGQGPAVQVFRRSG